MGFNEIILIGVYVSAQLQFVFVNSFLEYRTRWRFHPSYPSNRSLEIPQQTILQTSTHKGTLQKQKSCKCNSKRSRVRFAGTKLFAEPVPNCWGWHFLAFTV